MFVCRYVTKYHACHVKQRWMSQSATPATPTAAAPFPATPAQARHRSQPNAIRATPATQSEGRCHQVPRLPRETKVDVSKRNACHANSRGAIPATPAQVRHRSQPNAICATPATQSDHPCRQVPHLPRETKVDVSKCHACHTNSRGTIPATPAQVRHRSQPNAIRATPATQSEGRCHQIPRLPRETKVAVSKCHACHANSRGAIPGHSGPSAPPEPAQCHTCHACHTK